MDDPYDLKRFSDAQATVFDAARAELLSGQKRTHWMWFIFPQIAGLGSSPTGRRFAITGKPEAEAFLAHAILGARLRDCTQIVNNVAGRSVHQIFGSPDDMKFHSSMTLFAAVAWDNGVFNDALRLYFNGVRDTATLQRL